MNDGAIFIGEDMAIVRLDHGSAVDFATIVRDEAAFDDIVPATADCTLRFDPLKLSAEDAERAARAALARMREASNDARDPVDRREHLFTAHIGGKDGPDAQRIAEHLGLPGQDALAPWLEKRTFSVALVGFQPGFAYLEDCAPKGLPAIGRLDSPRQKVRAGSIGFLGARLCLYSLDGPGGWPIIGRIDERLFDPDASPPARLTAGDILRFKGT